MGRLRCALLLSHVLLVLAVAPPLCAQRFVLELDPTRTSIEFRVGATLHTVHGTLKLKKGDITFDTISGQASGRVVVDATSAGTGNEGRDNKMHREILESHAYPEITFSPMSVRGSIATEGTSDVQVAGIITLHGTDHEIATQATVKIAGEELNGETSFPVPYVKWGLKNPSTFFLRVNNTANLTVRFAGHLTMAQ